MDFTCRLNRYHTSGSVRGSNLPVGQNTALHICIGFRAPAGAGENRRLFCPTCQARRAKIFIFPKDRSYDLKKPARLDTGDVMAIRHQA
jgi:hypothetical protein